MTNVYLAGPWKHRSQARDVAERMRADGLNIISRWHDAWGATEGDEDSKDLVVLRQEATFDIQDVMKSDVMIVLNLCKSEGKAVEQGIAHALELPIILVGTKRFNVFSYLPNVQLVPDVDAAILACKALF